MMIVLFIVLFQRNTPSATYREVGPDPGVLKNTQV